MGQREQREQEEQMGQAHNDVIIPDSSFETNFHFRPQEVDMVKNVVESRMIDIACMEPKQRLLEYKYIRLPKFVNGNGLFFRDINEITQEEIIELRQKYFSRSLTKRLLERLR